jgi:hypothetical protein
VASEYRGAEEHDERLPELAADLLRRQVAVIVAVGGPPRRSQRRPRARRFPSSSRSLAPTRSNLAWSPASADREATSPAWSR